MKIKLASPEYLEKAAALSREDAERLFARMRGKLSRRLDTGKIDSLEAIALQLTIEDMELAEWRQRWSELTDRESNRSQSGQ
jgi:hypothetical protein